MGMGMGYQKKAYPSLYFDEELVQEEEDDFSAPPPTGASKSVAFSRQQAQSEREAKEAHQAALRQQEQEQKKQQFYQAHLAHQASLRQQEQQEQQEQEREAAYQAAHEAAMLRDEELEREREEREREERQDEEDFLAEFQDAQQGHSQAQSSQVPVGAHAQAPPPAASSSMGQPQAKVHEYALVNGWATSQDKIEVTLMQAHEHVGDKCRAHNLSGGACQHTHQPQQGGLCTQHFKILKKAAHNASMLQARQARRNE